MKQTITHSGLWMSIIYDEMSGPIFMVPNATRCGHPIGGVQQYATIAPGITSTGRPDVWTSFLPADTALVSDKILAKCDALDGVVDKMVGDPLACQSVFDIDVDVLTCSGLPDGTCLTYGQKAVLADVHAGARNSQGQTLYTNFLWKFGNSTGSRDPLAVGFIFIVPPEDPLVLNGSGDTLLDYALNWPGAAAGFDVDRDAPKIYATDPTYTESAMSFMTPPDLDMKQLWAKGGKLIVVQGTADPVFSVADTVNWYKALNARYKKRTTDFARLFIVPGMSHSSGGPACDQFDLVDALVNWVEEGIAPDAITAKARGGTGPGTNSEVPATWATNRTRPLCAYPAVARYIGTGSIEDAANFSCVMP
jgi:hypothetical protein